MNNTQTGNRLNQGAALLHILGVTLAGILNNPQMGYSQALSPDAPFVLSTGATTDLDTNQVHLVVLNTGESGAPVWHKPTAFGTGAWAMNLNSRRIGEWTAPKGDNPRPTLRMSESAILVTAATRVVLPLESVPFVLSGDKDGSGTVHLIAPQNNTIRSLTDWVLGGGPANVTIEPWTETNSAAKWQWRHDPMNPNAWVIKLGGFRTYEPQYYVNRAEREQNRREQELTQLIDGLIKLKLTETTGAQFQQAASYFRRFIDVHYPRNTTYATRRTEPETPLTPKAKALIQSANAWVEHYNRADNGEGTRETFNGIGVRRLGDGTGVHYQRKLLISEYDTLKPQVVEYLTAMRTATTITKQDPTKQESQDLRVLAGNILVFRIRINPGEQATK